MSSAVAWNKVMNMCQACRGAFCETYAGMTLKKARRYATRPNHVTSLTCTSTHVRVKSAIKCGTRTRLGKVCVRRGVLSSEHTSREQRSAQQQDNDG